MSFRERSLLIIAFLLIASILLLSFRREGEPIPPGRYAKLLGVGIDVNWARSPREILFYSPEVPKDFRRMGFSHVRIRVRANLSEEFLRHLDRVIDDSLRAGLIPVLACAAKEFNEDPSKMNALVQWWRTIARRYRDRPYLLSYDLIIEPSKEVTSEDLNRFYEKAIRAIREIDPYRIVFVAPRDHSNPFYLSELKVPRDGYLMAEWHFYASGPSKRNPAKLWTVGTEEERKLVTDKIKVALEWQGRTGIPTWVGAWMPGNYNKGNVYSVEEQVKFATFVSCQLRRAGIPYAVNADSHFYDIERRTWKEEMVPVLEAILNPECNSGGKAGGG